MSTTWKVIAFALLGVLLGLWLYALCYESVHADPTVPEADIVTIYIYEDRLSYDILSWDQHSQGAWFITTHGNKVSVPSTVSYIVTEKAAESTMRSLQERSNGHE